MRIRITEGKVPADHGEEDDSAAPKVSLNRVIPCFPLDDFGGSIAGRAAKRLEFFIFVEVSAESEVDDFELSVVVDEDVFWFEVAVSDVVGVEVVYCCDDLLEVGTGLLFGYSEWRSSYFFYFIIFLKSSPC